MDQRCKSFVVGLSTLLILSTGIPAFGDDIFVPRLGFTTATPPMIYLNVTSDKDWQTKEKAEEKAEKATEKADDQKLKSTAQHTETSSSDQKETAKKKVDVREEQRKKAEAERIAKAEALMKMRAEERAKEPVRGVFYLYDLKNGQLLFKDASKMEPSPSRNAIAPYYVKFSQNPVEGLYDVTVVGSGHRSDMPISVSNTAYWDALKPVVQDIGKAHCPLVKNKFWVIQRCAIMRTLPQGTPSRSALTKPQIIQGGWYTENDQGQGVLKYTPEVSNLTQTLLRIYEINPASFKYLTIPGDDYFESPYPDILDEANWGLQYLLTIQENNGGFPSGIEKIPGETDDDNYWLMPETPNSTARAIMALSSAVQAFKSQDLSLSIRFFEAAQKGWRYLESQKEQPDEETMLLASAGMMDASTDPQYKKAFEKAKAEIKTISPETALLLGPYAKGIPVQEGPNSFLTKAISNALPLAAKVDQNNPKATQELAQWVTNLYGYDKIHMVRDYDYVMPSAWSDPLQWIASRSGQLATQFGQRLSEENIIHSGTKVDSKLIKSLDKKEKEVHQRIAQGYDSLTLDTMDKANLAYILALLNQHVAFKLEKKKAPHQQREYPGVKDYYPKEI